MSSPKVSCYCGLEFTLDEFAGSCPRCGVKAELPEEPVNVQLERLMPLVPDSRGRLLWLHEVVEHDGRLVSASIIDPQENAAA